MLEFNPSSFIDPIIKNILSGDTKLQLHQKLGNIPNFYF